MANIDDLIKKQFAGYGSIHISSNSDVTTADLVNLVGSVWEVGAMSHTGGGNAVTGFTKLNACADEGFLTNPLIPSTNFGTSVGGGNIIVIPGDNIDVSAETITIPGHPFKGGESFNFCNFGNSAVTINSVAEVDPAGTLANFTWYVEVVDKDTIKAANSSGTALALAGTPSGSDYRIEYPAMKTLTTANIENMFDMNTFDEHTNLFDTTNTGSTLLGTVIGRWNYIKFTKSSQNAKHQVVLYLQPKKSIKICPGAVLANHGS
jgi:hypothetical protein